MKRITIALLLAAGCCYLMTACHKPDFPGKKFCQIKTIEDIYNPNPFTTTGRISNYAYTHRRLLDSITVRDAFIAETPVAIKVNYNHQGKPVTTVDNNNNKHKLIYENGLVVRVDILGADNQYQPKYIFLYDSLGRVIERQNGPRSALRFEYAGTSRNYIRKLQMEVLRPGPFPMFEILRKYEYQYDNKVHPWSTWPNTTLVPFYHEVVSDNSGWPLTHEFEPIPENNWVYQNVTQNFRGAQLLYREFFYTYEYDDVYPVKYELRTVAHNPFGTPPITTFGTTRFTWDCKGGGGNSQVNY
jgi:hypothetical protein